MIKSKGWNWNKVVKDKDSVWLNPSKQSFKMVKRWKKIGFHIVLDLGAGLGRHSFLFANNNFKVIAMDISDESLNILKEKCVGNHIDIEILKGDFLKIPLKENSVDAIFAFSVLSHTDTEGIKEALKEIRRVLKINGECYLNIASKKNWTFKNTDWPKIDENTKINKLEGAEYNVAHFYADKKLIKELFKDFKIISNKHIKTTFKDGNKVERYYHYHLLIKKV